MQFLSFFGAVFGVLIFERKKKVKGITAKMSSLVVWPFKKLKVEVQDSKKEKQSTLRTLKVKKVQNLSISKGLRL